MIDEPSDVILTTDLPRFDLRAGDMGTVVMVHDGGSGYTVELTTLSGKTVAVATLAADQAPAIAANDVAHALWLPPTP